MSKTAADFGFLSDDIRTQRDIAQDALNEAKSIDDLLKASPELDEKAQRQLEKTKETLLRVARGLTANATSTSSLATITFLGARAK